MRLFFQPVEVADVVAVLDDAEFFEFAQGVLVGLNFGDTAGAVEDDTIVKLEESIEAFGPAALHGHRDPPTGAGLGQLEKGVDQVAEGVELVKGQVVAVIRNLWIFEIGRAVVEQ